MRHKVMKPKGKARSVRRRTPPNGAVMAEHRGNRAQRRKQAALERKR